MTWRPDNWKNPIGDFIPDIGKGQQWAFERGADAMLKALRAKPAIRLCNTLETVDQYVIKVNDLPDGIWRVLLIPEIKEERWLKE